MTKKFMIFIIVMGLLIPSLSAGKNGIAVDDGRNEVWKQSSGSVIGNNGRLLRSLRDSGLLNNIRDVRLDGVTASVSGNLIRLYNLHVISDTTDFDDYLSVDLLIDAESLRLVPTTVEIASDLGVYYRDEYLFSKDVAQAIYMTTPTGNTLSSDMTHAITARYHSNRRRSVYHVFGSRHSSHKTVS